MKKIVYKNLTFGGDPITIALEDKYETQIEIWVFNNCHRYEGDKMLGHGIGTYETYDVSREPDEMLLKEIHKHRTEMDHLRALIIDARKKLQIPYIEKSLGEHTIGSLPTKEELLKDGWTNDQIDTAFLRLGYVNMQ